MKRFKLSLLEIASEDDEEHAGSLDVTATVAATGRQDARLEKLVASVAVDPAVTAASWKITRLDEESPLEHEISE